MDYYGTSNLLEAPALPALNPIQIAKGAVVIAFIFWIFKKATK